MLMQEEYGKRTSVSIPGVLSLDITLNVYVHFPNFGNKPLPFRFVYITDSVIINRMEGIKDEYIIHLFYQEKREQEAFRLLMNKYKERLYWHVRKILISHEDTDDILQNVFVKIWQGLKEFRYESKLYTWMYRIATNEALNFLNEKRRKVYGNSDEISDFLENTLESDPYFSGDDIQKELQRAILTLSDRQRVIFNMKYFDDMPYEEMAQVLDVAVGTLKATYHNAVKKIEASLKIVDTLN